MSEARIFSRVRTWLTKTTPPPDAHTRPLPAAAGSFQARRTPEGMPAPAIVKSDKSTAFRLVNELEGLVRGIAADHVIVPEETDRLVRWLAEAEPYRSVQPFRNLAEHIDRVLDDGVLTLDECEDLLFVTSNLTTVNPHFDQMRGGLQQLMGFLTGVAADGRIHAHEAQRLSSWAEEWSHLKGLWPYDECETMVVDLLNTKVWTDQPRRLMALAAQLPIAGGIDTTTGEVAPLLIGGVCAVAPDVVFDGRTFVFTGESEKCERSQLHAVVTERRGLPVRNVSRKTDYLIVCPEGSPYWAFACYGRKVERAIELRREGHRLQIVHERDFWDALVA